MLRKQQIYKEKDDIYQIYPVFKVFIHHYFEIMITLMCITAKEPNMYDLMRKLPIGIQTFEDIRRKNYLYVDKTALVWRMANMGKPYFLSRPRRFGKSLLLSTFESYF